jgi:hypothetical protein
LAAEVSGRAAKYPDEDAAHGVGTAETARGGDLVDGVGTLLETSAGALDTKALDESRRRRAGLAKEHAGKMAGAHRAAIGEG